VVMELCCRISAGTGGALVTTAELVSVIDEAGVGTEATSQNE
jgi:hypothetical protein